MGKRPLLLLFSVFAAGVLLGKAGIWLALPMLAVSVIVIVCRKEKGVRGWLVPLLCLLLFPAGALRTESELRFRASYLPELVDGQNVRVAGKIDRIERKDRCVFYYLTDCVLDESSKTVPCNDVLVYLSDDDYSIGQILIVRGTITLFDSASNEGSFDAGDYYRSQKIDFGVWVEEAATVVEPSVTYRSILAGFCQKLADSAEMCGASGGILSAMLLGEKAGLDTEVKSLYQKAGISHILAISGLHVSLLGVGLYRLLRRCGGCYAASAAVTGLLTVSYCIMTGGSVSTRRAVLMLLICLFADLIGRGYDMLSALGLTGIVLLWDNPFLIGYSGFVFSVAAVFGVGVTATVLVAWRESFCPACISQEKDCANRWGSVRNGLSASFFSSLGIQLTTLPLVAFYYYEIPVYSLFLNLFVLILVKYVVLLGAAAVAVGLVCVPLGRILMMPCNGILALYAYACKGALALPCAVITVGCPSRGKLLAYYALLALILFVLQRRTVVQKRQNDGTACMMSGGMSFGTENLRSGIRRLCAVSVMWAVLLSVLLFRFPETAEVDILDVGQGDGIYLCTSDGTRIFFDGGSSDVSAVGQYRILPFLKYRGVKKIDYWFVSHSDADHVSGLAEVLKSGFPVGRLIFARAACEDVKTAALGKLAHACGTEVSYMETGDALVTKSSVLRCVYPSADEKNEDRNALSLVLLLEDAGFQALFTGDIPAEVETRLLAEDAVGHVDLLKAAHHGSKYSSSYAFLQRLSPSVAVISCGAGNRYGHPGEEALMHIRESGADAYLTMDGGRIRIRYDGKNARVEAYRN